MLPRRGRRVNRQASCSGIALGLDEMQLALGDGLRQRRAATERPTLTDSRSPGPDELAFVASDSWSLPASLHRVVKSSARSHSGVEPPLAKSSSTDNSREF